MMHLNHHHDSLLTVLSVFIAIFASFITLFIVSRGHSSVTAYVAGSLTMGAAIAGMHYIGIASMRMAAGFTGIRYWCCFRW